MERVRLMEVVKLLKKNSLFKKWKENHPSAFLSHLFCSLDTQCKKKKGWEAGFFENGKATVFVQLSNGFSIKPEEEVFKKPEEEDQKLLIKGIIPF